MPIPVFVNAYRRAYELRERALRAADAGLYDAAAFYEKDHRGDSRLVRRAVP